MELVKTFGDIEAGDTVRRELGSKPYRVLQVTTVEPNFVDLRLDYEGSSVYGWLNPHATPIILSRRPWSKGADEAHWRSLIGSRMVNVNEVRRYYPNDLAQLRAAYVRLREALEEYELGLPETQPSADAA
jgi:hypothetical protein